MGRGTATLPASEDATIMVTILADTVTDDIIAFAVSTLKIEHNELPMPFDGCEPPTSGANGFNPVDTSSVPFHQSELALKLIDSLMAHLDACQQQGLKAHVYTFDSKEKNILCRLLIVIALDKENVDARMSHKAYIIYSTSKTRPVCLF